MLEGFQGMDVKRILKKIEEAVEPSEVYHFIRMLICFCIIYWLCRWIEMTRLHSNMAYSFDL